MSSQSTEKLKPITIIVKVPFFENYSPQQLFDRALGLKESLLKTNDPVVMLNLNVEFIELQKEIERRGQNTSNN